MAAAAAAAPTGAAAGAGEPTAAGAPDSVGTAGGASKPFVPGDGVEVTGADSGGDATLVGATGSVLVVDGDVVTVELDAHALTKLGAGGAGDTAPADRDFPASSIAHMLPGDTFQPGWWPYEPTAEQRSAFGRWARRGLTADEMASYGAEPVAVPPYWQRDWTSMPDGCGDWCCYSFECGHLECEACHRSAVWPTCPDCGTKVRSETATTCSKRKCGADVSAVLFPTRYVCSTQVAVRCGFNGSKTLDPTHCTCLCESCYATAYHEHLDFVAVRPDGTHEPVRRDVDAVLALARAEAAVYVDGARSLGVSPDDVLPRAPAATEARGEAESAEADASGLLAAWRAHLAALHAPDTKAAVAAAIPRRTVADGEEVMDCIDWDDLEPGDEYVSPWACDHNFKPETAAACLKDKPSEWGTCPAC